MGLLNRLTSHREIDFAKLMVEKIYRQFPPTSEPQLAKKGAQRRLEAIVETLMLDIEAFQKERRLGLLGKARLGNAFRWQLADRGYSKEFAEAITEGVIKQVALYRPS